MLKGMPEPLAQARRREPNDDLLPAVREIGLTQCLQWLTKGWRDTLRGGALSLVHGLLVALGGLAMLLLAGQKFWLLAGAFSGFLVIAPVLATSLYAISRALEKGESVNLSLITQTWTRWQYSRYAVRGGYWSMVRFGLLLGLAGTGWVLTSASLITLLAPQPVNTPMDFLRYVVLSPKHYVFELWLTLGGLMAAPLFASSVVSMPLLLDRRATVMQAVLTSWQAVLRNPAALALWAGVIMLLTLLGMATAMLGLILIIPWLGHASWHAYRDLVDASSLPERMPPEERL
jgi:uncharacterized membrane protein